jgi:hypothetical protein
MVPLGVRIAAFFSVPMVVATSASAEEKKKAAPPQSRQSRVMFAIGKRTRRGHAAWSQIDPKATLGRSALLTSVRTFGSARSGPLADLDDGVSVAGQHARACDQSMFSMRSRAFAHPPQVNLAGRNLADHDGGPRSRRRGAFRLSVLGALVWTLGDPVACLMLCISASAAVL